MLSSLAWNVKYRHDSQQKAYHDRQAKDRRFGKGDSVFVRNFCKGPTWLPRCIEQTSGPVSYRVRLADGRQLRCHQDQVRKRVGRQVELSPTEEEDFMEMEGFPVADNDQTPRISD